MSLLGFEPRTYALEKHRSAFKVAIVFTVISDALTLSEAIAVDSNCVLAQL